MPRVPFKTHDEAASFAAAVGFGKSFFGSGQLAALVDQYKSERNLDTATAAVEVSLQDRSTFFVSHVRVAHHFVVFYTEDDEHICVPYDQVAKVRIGRRTKPSPARQMGFAVEVLEEPDDSSS